MRTRRFAWEGGAATAAAIRGWAGESAAPVDVGPIRDAVREGGDAAVLRLTAELDATEAPPTSLAVAAEARTDALAALDPALREALETAAANIRAVASAQLREAPVAVSLPEGQRVELRDVPVEAVGIYAPGGRAAYPSSVLMGVLPAREAGVERVVLATPPGPGGDVNGLVLAAAELAGVDEVYAMGGAQAIFALAHGTETVAAVDVIAGPGNNWVREAKRAVYGRVGIDSLAGPSELMVALGSGVDPAWAALDLCAQAEHGVDGLLVAAGIEATALEELEEATLEASAERAGVAEAPLAVVETPAAEDAIRLADALAPEHLELLGEPFESLAGRVRTAGCVFAGAHSATAFGDYAAGSNHVLPTGGAGRFSGPLGPDTFRRRIATVEVSAGAAAKLAPVVDAIARAEGFPVHGESAMIRRDR